VRAVEALATVISESLPGTVRRRSAPA